MQQKQRIVSNSLSRAVAQVNGNNKRNVSSPSSCSPRRLTLLLIMLSPLVLILPVIYILSIYNVAVADLEQQQQQQLKLKTENENNNQNHNNNGNSLGLRGVVSSSNKNNNFIVKQPPVEIEQKVVEVVKTKEKEEEQQQQTTITTKEILILKLDNVGTIRIILRPDLSLGSIDYIHQLIKEGCKKCNFYRAEKPGILQGVMKNMNVPINKQLGGCPSKYKDIKNDCPEWDSKCNCHGPIMTKGSVGWAAGTAGGPDFFIDNYKNPAKFWGTQHTNFGTIDDEESFHTIDIVWTLPATKNRSGMTLLNDHIHFTMELETTTTN